MSCPHCEQPEEEMTGRYRLHEITYEYALVDLEMHCRNCDKIFWQRYQAPLDESMYENLADVGEETEFRCPHCGGFVCKNNYYDPNAEEGIESYPYVCPDCDENFYGIEVIKENNQEE